MAGHGPGAALDPQAPKDMIGYRLAKDGNSERTHFTMSKWDSSVTFKKQIKYTILFQIADYCLTWKYLSRYSLDIPTEASEGDFACAMFGFRFHFKFL